MVAAVWQRRFYDLKVSSEKNRREELNYPHRNAMKIGVSQLSLVVTCHSLLAAALMGRGLASGSISWGMIPSFPRTAYCDRTHRQERDVPLPTCRDAAPATDALGLSRLADYFSA